MNKFITGFLLLFMCSVSVVDAQMFFGGTGVLPLPPQSITISLPRIAGPLPQPLVLPQGWESADLVDIGDGEFVTPATYRKMMEASSVRDVIENLPAEADFVTSYQDINLGNGQNPNNPSELDPGFWQKISQNNDYAVFRPIRDQSRTLRYYFQRRNVPARWEMTKTFRDGTRYWWNGWQRSPVQHIAGA